MKASYLDLLDLYEEEETETKEQLEVRRKEEDKHKKEYLDILIRRIDLRGCL